MPYSAYTNWENEEKYLNNLINSGNSGQKIWAENQLGVMNAAKASYSPIQIDESIGSFTNALDTITAMSAKSSARSLDYAKQQQDWSANQAAIANQFSAQEAAKNRDWQEYMSNTSHQREIRDLKAAGLNPVLSAMGGNGASVTSGATASASLPSGSRADSDTSANGALVQLLGSMLSAQTAIENQLVSARTQEAVADKYTAMSKITAEIAASAAMYGADTSYRINADFPNSMVRIIDSMLAGTGNTWSDIGGKIEGYVEEYIENHPSLYKDLKGKVKDISEWIKDKFTWNKDQFTPNYRYTGKGSGRSF